MSGFFQTGFDPEPPKNKYTEFVALRLDPELLARLKKLKDENKTDLSQTIRRLLKKALETEVKDDGCNN